MLMLRIMIYFAVLSAAVVIICVIGEDDGS